MNDLYILIRQQRVGVIPPKSQIAKSDFRLTQSYKKIPENATFTPANTFLRFRNYLTYGFNEDLNNDAAVVDNEFFVGSVKKIKAGKKDRYKANDSKCGYIIPLVGPKDSFVRMDSFGGGDQAGALQVS